MRILILVAAAFVAACGTPQPKCTVMNCMGCCDQMTDTCKAGTEATACGKGGTLCISCPSSQVCGSSQTCANPAMQQQCNATTCAGCCDDTGTCFRGQSVDSCGTSGATCSVCAMGQSCVAVTMGNTFGGRCM